MSGRTANPNALPFGMRSVASKTVQPNMPAAPTNSVTQGAGGMESRETVMPADAFTQRRWQATMPDAAHPKYDPSQSLTPRLDLMPRTNPNATQDSNRSGAFGTGAQNLQRRRDLFNQMAAATPEERDAFKGQAASLGVTPAGWEAAARKINIQTTPSATVSATAAISQPRPGTMQSPFGPRKTWEQSAKLQTALPLPAKPTAAQTLALTAPLPPVAPLPNQVPAPAKNPYSVAPTTGASTIADARASTQAAINIGKTPAPAARPAPAPVSPIAAQTAASPTPSPVPLTPRPTWQQAAGMPAPAANLATNATPPPVAAAPALPNQAPAPAKPKQVTDKNPVTFQPAPHSDWKAMAKEKIDADMQAEAARKKRIKTKKDAVKIPAWQEGTILGGWNRGIQRYAANWTT